MIKFKVIDVETGKDVSKEYENSAGKISFNWFIRNDGVLLHEYNNVFYETDMERFKPVIIND